MSCSICLLIIPEIDGNISRVVVSYQLCIFLTKTLAVVVQKFNIEYEQNLEKLKGKHYYCPSGRFGTKINKVAVILDKMQVLNDSMKS